MIGKRALESFFSRQDWANLEGGRCRSLVMYAIRLTRKTRNARQGYSDKGYDARFGITILPGRLPEIQALKDLIVNLPGYEAFNPHRAFNDHPQNKPHLQATKELESGDSDEVRIPKSVVASSYNSYYCCRAWLSMRPVMTPRLFDVLSADC